MRDLDGLGWDWIFLIFDFYVGGSDHLHFSDQLEVEMETGNRLKVHNDTADSLLGYGEVG